MKSLPIRLRLTLWYFGMFAAAALLLSAASWWMLDRSLEATLHQDLQERIDDVRAQLQQLGPLAPTAAAQQRFDAIYRERDDGKWLQIRGENGQWIYRSARIARLDAPLPLPEALARTGQTGEIAEGARPIRVLSEPVRASGRTWSVESGISLTKPDALLRRYGIDLLLLTPTMLLLASLGGHAISRKALAPVAAITQEARRISDKNLDLRLPVLPANDELAELSLTLNHMLARIDRAFRATREFTANASHELRTPLARLRAEAEIALLATRDVHDYRQALERVQSDAVSMSLLIESLLTLARADAGRQSATLSPVDLRELVNDALVEWRPMAEQLRIRLRAQRDGWPRSEQILVWGDQLLLGRLLRIWLDNAFKFTPADGIVAILVAAQERDVSLAVEDTGVGIAPEHHERIFDRFYLVDGDTAHSQRGSGLGLSMAAWIAQQHNSRIVVRSALGRGARFEISLARFEQDASDKKTVGFSSISSVYPAELRH